jgi:hypothetical protein
MKAVSHEVNIDVLVRRPVSLKVVEERRPIVRQVVFVEIFQREGKSRGRSLRGCEVLLKDGPPAIRQSRFVSSIGADSADQPAEGRATHR